MLIHQFDKQMHRHVQFRMLWIAESFNGAWSCVRVGFPMPRSFGGRSQGLNCGVAHGYNWILRLLWPKSMNYAMRGEKFIVERLVSNVVQQGEKLISNIKFWTIANWAQSKSRPPRRNDAAENNKHLMKTRCTIVPPSKLQWRAPQRALSLQYSNRNY